MRKKMDISKNGLMIGDCLDHMKKWHKNGTKEFIDLCYIDPPFNSQRNYNVLYKDDMELSEEAFSDIWSRTLYTEELENLNPLNPNLYSFLKLLETTNLPKAHLSYLTIMGITCWYIREMLKPTGSFYYHCDPTMSHYIKIMLDYIFGGGNFRNEIVWYYTNGGGRRSDTPNWKHDILLYYSKSNKFTYNGKKLGDVRNKDQSTFGGYFKKDSDGREYQEVRVGGKIYTYYCDEPKNMDDVWPIQIISQRDTTERLGYPTQKPEKLLERIILASSNPNDLVVDFYNGGGTTVSVAAKNGRRYIGCDINSRALAITEQRLIKLNKVLKKDFIIQGLPGSTKQLRKLVDENKFGSDKNSKFALEDVVVKYYLEGVIGNVKKVGDNSIDGVFGFTYAGKQYKGIVQVTSTASINHFKAFCSEIGKSGDVGVYVTFEDTITDGIIRKAKSYGKLGPVDVVQILTLENLIDRKKQFEIPKDVMTF